ncbi:hypothetical protein SH1V18_24390 [Vallitalea longa]|uniref:Uncharacterized protein n=1 Tax=Vallitalea longa TaxID=2936439 RepID=A0A9W6DGN7_9FIRM|nr:hypothetical protein [Vallitalea longa]GKX29959.1 hypothetical protein SH1V18_24390 [Vallitalea longa]
MSIILGLFTLLLSIAIPLALLLTTNFQVIHFALFFIIPVGAIFTGYLCGYGYFKGLVLSNRKITGGHYFVGLIMAIVCLVSVLYGTYYLSCFNEEEQKIEYSLEGNHVSDYEVNGYGEMTFPKYTRYMIENTPVSFSIRSTNITEVSNPIFGWIVTIIDYLGLLAGCLACGSSIYDKYEYCDNCKKYKKKKKIFDIPKPNGKGFFDELETLVNNLNMSIFLEEIIDKYKNDRLKTGEYYECYLIYCESCRSASFKFKLYEKNKKGKVVENDDFKYTIDVNYDFVRNYIKKDAA